MKNRSLLNVLVCALPVVILPVAFSVAAFIGEPDIFGVGGMLRYIWVMWLFAPLYLIPIFYGIHKKKRFEPFVQYFAITAVMLTFLLLFGSYRFFFSGVFDYSTDRLSYIEGFADVEIPDQVKMVTEHFENMQDFDPYYVSRIKITEAVEADAFEKAMAQDDRWVLQLPTAVKGLLPSYHQMEMQQFDCYMFYNITDNTYNSFPTADYNNCILLAYDAELNYLFVLNDLVVRPVL